jgi:hypothetical protein
MKQTSEKSKEIIKLLESGLRQFEVQKMGYPINTIRYYYRKINKPRKFKRLIKQIQGYNRARYNRLDKTKK